MMIFDPNSKPEIIRINISEPLLLNKKCKHCGGGASIYYYLRNPSMWFNPRKAMDQANYIRMLLKHLQSQGMFDSPKDYTSISPLSHDVGYSKYRPRLHRTIGCSPHFDVVEFLSCDCMKTTWAYTDKASRNRPEIYRRKGRYKFSRKFEF